MQKIHMKPSIAPISPRKTLAATVTLLCIMALHLACNAAEPVHLVLDSPIPPQAALALTTLERVLQKRGSELQRRAAMDEGATSIIIGVAHASTNVDRILQGQAIQFQGGTESLCIRRLHKNGHGLLIAGGDGRGLNYALREVSRAIELAAPGGDPLAAVQEAVETPFLARRSLTMHLFNHDLEQHWYGDEKFWDMYLSMLADNRFNNFTLTFADQTNYLCPPYAYLTGTAEFPAVKVEGLSEADRQQNLARLRRISEMARERGLEFTLGIWTQMPVEKFAGKILAKNLPAGPAAADYCAAGLREVLRACPAISGVQLRMNAEAGVPEDQQAAFYHPLFRAMRDVGRPVRVDLRYKGLRPDTIADAVATGLDVTVSTKVWAEHMGLPYHVTMVDSHYRADRYSFGAMLKKPRKYRVTYRLWTVGSQRVLLWGDPDYAARFAQSCKLGDGEGFEIFAPLTDKGFGDTPGSWKLFADRSYDGHDWEIERYWYDHLCFGRMGYNPDCNPEVWRREFRHRFGDAAEQMEAAYHSASQIVPLITAARLPSASEWSWWPEMDTGDRLAEYAVTQAGDPAQFYAISTWKRTPLWRCEAWDSNMPGFVEDAMAGRVRGKWTPMQVSQRLEELAQHTLKNLVHADPARPEFRDTVLDMRILAALAQYHAAKTRAATDLAFFNATGEAGRLAHALPEMKDAEAAWERIVRLTDGVYNSNLIFGYGIEQHRPQGHHHTGHWKDRLPVVLDDVTNLEKLVTEHAGDNKLHRIFPGEEPIIDLPQFEHVPVLTARAGSNLRLTVHVKSAHPLKGVVLHFRRLNQTLDWEELPMHAAGDGAFEATIPGAEISARWDLQYYFEAMVEGGGKLWPSWERGVPWVVVKVQ
jgi:hypothetical protein